MTACPGQGSGPDFGYQVGLPSPAPNGTFPSWGSTIHQIGNLVIVTMPTSDPAGNVRVSCFDPATHGLCPGWTGAFALPNSTSGNYASGALPTLSAAGAVTGFCININNGANDAGTTLFWDCFDLTGKAGRQPAWLPGQQLRVLQAGVGRVHHLPEPGLLPLPAARDLRPLRLLRLRDESALHRCLPGAAHQHRPVQAACLGR